MNIKNLVVILSILIVVSLSIYFFNFIQEPGPVTKSALTRQRLEWIHELIQIAQSKGIAIESSDTADLPFERKIAGIVATQLTEDEIQSGRLVQRDASGMVILDAWGRPIHAWMENGMNLILLSSGPNGINQKGSGDDLVVQHQRQPQ